MKTNRKIFITYLSFAASLAFSLVSCRKEIHEPDKEPVKGQAFEVIASSIESKTGNNGLKTEWTAKDAINLFFAQSGTTKYHNTSKFTTEDNGSTAVFSGVIPDANPLYETNDWYAFYPYTEELASPANVSQAAVIVGSESDGSQEQLIVDRKNHLAGPACPLYAGMAAVDKNDTPTLRFRQLSSVINIRVKNSSVHQINVRNIAFTAGENIIGKFYIDFSGETVSYKAVEGAAAKTAKLKIWDGPVKTGESGDFYLVVKPFAAAAGSVFTISVNGVEKYITLDKAVNFKAGDINTVTFNFTDEDSESGDRDMENAVWQNIKGVHCPVPPVEHPRLYVRKSELQQLEAKLASADGKTILKKLTEASQQNEPVYDPNTSGYRDYETLYGPIAGYQLSALKYLVYGEEYESAAVETITGMLDMLKNTDFGTKNDMSRASGIRIMTGAMVYDWCYDLMTSDQKNAYITEFKRIAGTMECKFPPKGNEPVVGHASEWMLLRDLLSAGIAVYEEDTEIYDEVISLLMRDYVPVRNYTYKGHNYHQGTGYVNVRFVNDLNAMFILDKMGVKNIFDDDIRYVMYPLLYLRRPDGQMLPSGDCNAPRKGASVINYSMLGMLAGTYFNDPYLIYEYERRKKVENHMLILELLWRNFELKGQAPDDLPLTHYSGSPFGSMVARTSWDGSPVIAEMKVNEQHFANHMHLDAGSFQIYYKGALAIDSGAYNGTNSGYNSDHSKNYYKRTIAHNSLLIYNPEEKFACWNYGGGNKTEFAANDGGQRMPGDRWDAVRSLEQLTSSEYTTGKTLAHQSGPDKYSPEFSYLKGDITQAYSSSKVRDVRRSFAFLNLGAGAAVPAAMVIFDHIESAKPSFGKYWLLHSVEEPVISGSGFTVSRTSNGESGMLTCSVLLPESNKIAKVGGQGHEFDVFGVNYPNGYPGDVDERGEWRVEVTPANAAAVDNFLTVLQVSDNGSTMLYSPAMIEGNTVVGASVGDRAVIFSKDSKELGAELNFELSQANFADSGTLKVLVTDLAAGSWQVLKGSKVIVGPITVKADEGTLYFTADGSGSYRLSKL